MLGVPEFDDDEDNAPVTPTRAMQDALIEQVNDLLEDEWEWDAAAPNRANVLRLYAEMLWWRDHSWQIPWIH